MKKPMGLIAVATGWGAKHYATALGPGYLKEHKIEQLMQLQGHAASWLAQIISPTPYNDQIDLSYEQKVNEIKAITYQLAQTIMQVYPTHFPLVLGGDDSISIGTWSGLMRSVKGSFGLIWIDAHMDSHTPETTPSFNIHGMPLAVLMGYGEPALVAELDKQFLDPKHLVLMATRSYEAGEVALLKALNVKIYFMDEIKARGFEATFNEAKEYLRQQTNYFGISLDIDAFDPTVAPGTGSREPNGLMPEAVCNAFKQLNNEEKLAAFQIAEFNPTRDRDNKTFKLILNLLLSLLGKDVYDQ